MSLKIRRVVTGHDDQGRAKVLIDEQVKNVISSRPGANSSVIWSSIGFPVNNDGDRDPSQIFYHAVPQRIRKVGNNYELQLHLPFVGKEDVDIKHREGELFVSVGPYKREISLPRVLNGKRVTKGRLDEGMLLVTFSDRKP